MMKKKSLIELKKILISSKKIIYLLILSLFVSYFLSGFFSVSQNELGLQIRFGKVIDNRIPPGMHYSLPYPIDKIIKIPVTTINRIVINDFYEDEYNDTYYAKTGLSSYCITGDNNVINIRCIVQYLISDPFKYTFKFNSNNFKRNNIIFLRQQNEKIIKNVLNNSLIHCLSNLKVDEILTVGKRKISNYLIKTAQKKLDKFDLGIDITSIELNNVNPPKIIQEYFDDVINAKIEKNKMVNEALAKKNEKVPKTKAQAHKIISKAQRYKTKIISKAEGESHRFLNILKTYKNSKELTKKRLYIDFIKKVYPHIYMKYIVATNKNNKKSANLKINVNKK